MTPFYSFAGVPVYNEVMKGRSKAVGRESKPSAASRATLAREIALEVLVAVRQGGFAEEALSERLDKAGANGDDRALATELVYGILRWRDRLDGIIDRCLDRPERRVAPLLRDILRMAFYQLFILDKVPDHAAVDQAVTLARRRLGGPSAGFANAVLRRGTAERRQDVPPEESDPEIAARYYSHPKWLVERWMTEYGPEGTRRILTSNNTAARLVLRVNTLKAARLQVEELLQKHGVPVDPVPGLPNALIPGRLRAPVASIPGYGRGWFVVQGRASQMIAPLLRTRTGDRVLDACAAPGGKAAHIAALAGNQVGIITLDVDAERVELMRGNLNRLGVTCAVPVVGDAGSTEFMHAMGAFDRVLVDAPCSNTGVFRHNPEARYRASPGTVHDMSRVQIRILCGSAAALKPGGTLLYSVCSVTAEETVEVVEAFLRDRPDFSIDPLSTREVAYPALIDSRGFFSTYPPVSEDPPEGFFAARFIRS